MKPEKPKLQKFLADRGLGSRRDMEKWILEDRVKINREIAQIGSRVSPSDRIQVDGRFLSNRIKRNNYEWLIYHKPTGEVTTRRDTHDRKTVFDRLPNSKHRNWISVGRLDINTSGLLLFTTNGKLANYFMHPSSRVIRIYLVRVQGKLSQQELTTLRQGIQVGENVCHFDDIKYIGGSSSNFWYQIKLFHGHYREIRTLFSHTGHETSRLMRIQYGEFTMPHGLKQGQWRYLDPAKNHYLKSIISRTATVNGNYTTDRSQIKS